ncbi:hypothetical protein JHK87_054483 [Glycine soja]|nr:hypothetical protein JHK87_054483 [Glycine soja]
MIGAAPRVGPPRVSSRARASRSLGLRRTSNMGLVAILSLRPRRLFLYTALCCSSFPSFWVATSYNSFCIMQPF